MSNYKSTLQSNNEALNSNNLDLQSLIDQANNLPDAGGGSSGEGYAEADSLIAMEMSTYTNNRVTTIGKGAFAYAPKLASVSFPACTTINDSAFYHCSNLTTANFPVCKTIGNSAFYYCGNLTTVSFPAATNIDFYAFYCCDKLTTISFPATKTIGNYAFCGCNKLVTPNFPVAETIGSSAFQGCFIDRLTTASFPAVTNIGDSAFDYCVNLTTVSLPAAAIIGQSVFIGCFNLSQLYLTGPSLCTLSNPNAFASTPYAGYSYYFKGTPHIYVPASLVDAYKSATNWTYFSKYISAIGSEDTGGGDTGGLIKFTIDDIEYQAEPNMTWHAWCASEYNTDGYYINGLGETSTVFNDDLEQIYGVYGNDIINANCAYNLTFFNPLG